MAARSSIDRDPRVKAAVDEALASGATIDEVLERIAGEGVSRSAIGRYAKKYRPIVEETQRFRAVAKVMREQLGVDGTDLTELAIQQSEVAALRSLLAINEAEDELGSKDGAGFARWVRTNAAAKGEIVKLRLSEIELIRKQAADDAEDAAREGGASDEQIDLIRRRILGIAD